MEVDLATSYVQETYVSKRKLLLLERVAHVAAAVVETDNSTMKKVASVTAQLRSTIAVDPVNTTMVRFWIKELVSCNF